MWTKQASGSHIPGPCPVHASLTNVRSSGVEYKKLDSKRSIATVAEPFYQTAKQPLALASSRLKGETNFAIGHHGSTTDKRDWRMIWGEGQFEFLQGSGQQEQGQSFGIRSTGTTSDTVPKRHKRQIGNARTLTHPRGAVSTVVRHQPPVRTEFVMGSILRTGGDSRSFDFGRDTHVSLHHKELRSLGSYCVAKGNVIDRFHPHEECSIPTVHFVQK